MSVPRGVLRSIGRRWLRGVACALLLAASSCERRAAPGAPPAPAPSSEARGARRVRVSAELLRDAGIEVAAAAIGPLNQGLTLAGEVAAVPDRSARLSAPVAGHVERVMFNEGSTVRKGDVLVILRVPDLGKLRGAFVSTTARASAARRAAERTRSLGQDHAASEQQQQDTEAQAEALEAEARALGQQLAALGAGPAAGGAFDLPLPAPVTGVVTRRAVVVGQPLGVAESVAEICDLGEVWFLAHAYEKDLGRLREGSEARVVINAYPDDAFQGRVTLLASQVDPVTRTITARIPLANRGGELKIGLAGTATVAAISADAGALAIVVPRSALSEIERRPVIFVRVAGGEFEVREVTLGAASVENVALSAGVAPGELIAVKGVFSLKSVALKSTLAEED